MSRDLLIVAISILTWGVGESTFLDFLPLHLQRLGANPLEIGGILSAAGVVITFVHIPAGFLADRIGRRAIMWASWLVGTAAGWMMALAGALPLFVAGLLLYRSTMFVVAPMNSYITAARGKWTVTQAMTRLSAFYAFGTVVGPTLGGWIGDRFGLEVVLYVAVGFFTISSLLILFIKPQPVEKPVAADAQDKHLPAVLWLYLGVLLLVMFATYLPQPLTANFLENERSLTLGQIGRLYTIANLGAVVLQLALGQLPAGIGFVLAQGALAGFAFTLWRLGGMPLYALGFFMLGGYRTGRSLAAALASDMVKGAQMGLAYGLVETVGGVGVILAPLLASWLYVRQPVSVYPVALLFIAVSILASLVFFLLGARFVLARQASKQPGNQ